MNGQVIACADMVSRVDPDVQTLRGIIESCRESYQALTGSTARIVSLADKGSQEKVVAASDSLCPHLILDSNMTGFPSSSNIYVLPDLLAANPLYKMMQWMTGTGGFYSMNARGFDLSRGDKPDDIVRVACYAVVTADMMRRQNRMPVSQDIFRLG